MDSDAVRVEFVELLSPSLKKVKTILVDELGLKISKEIQGEFVEFDPENLKLCFDRAGRGVHATGTKAVVAFSACDLDRIQAVFKKLQLPVRKVHDEHGDSLIAPLDSGIELVFFSRS